MLAVGAAAGVLAGLLGVGGGIVIVAALFIAFEALGHPAETMMHVCVATSLATITPTSLRAFAAHHARGGADIPLLRGWSPWIALGAVIGVLIASVARSDLLAMVFAVAAFFVALQMGLAPASARLASAPPTGLRRNAAATALGGVSTIMGIGGGTFGVPLLTLWGVPVHRAVATAAGFGAIIALPATIGFIAAGWGAPDRPAFTLGYVHLPAVAVITPMTVLCAPYGAKLAHSADPKTLRLIFAAFLAVTALNMARKTFYG
ncbi:MAG: sulfite exporter TauE/SafE family protein [Pseudomonadota bacterium]